MKAGAIILGVTLMIGYLFGLTMASPEIEVVERTVTETETIEVEVPTPAEIPAACSDMIDTADRIVSASRDLDGASSELLEIMSKLRIAVATTDGNTANELETQLRALDGTTVDAVQTMGESYGNYETDVDTCLEGVE